MSTNFYALKLPTMERKKELTELLNSDDFNNILSEMDTTFGDFQMDGDVPIGGKIHLGKRSAGWKFLWNPNIYCIKHGHMVNSFWTWEPNTYFSLYPLTVNGIWNFINNPNIIVINEYNEIQDKEKFFDGALKWITWKGKPAWDSKSYAEWERSHGNQYDCIQYKNDLVDHLISEGYKMISESCTDFYSDGLRFSTSTKFS